MKNAAQHEMYEERLDAPPAGGQSAMQSAAMLRQLAAERLAAHRSRRAALEPVVSVTAVTPQPLRSEAAERARAAVEARYRQTPSFQEVMERGAVDVEVPEIGVSPLRAAAFGRDDGDLGPDQDVSSVEEGEEVAVVPPTSQKRDVGHPVPGVSSMLDVRTLTSVAQSHEAEEIAELNEEIEFRMTPEFADHLLEPLPIQANIIEFPRQLVAAKKARPRLAEGPLRSDEVQETETVEAVAALAEPEFQMRIFEVEEAEVEEAAVVAPTSPPSQAQRRDLSTGSGQVRQPASVRSAAEAQVQETQTPVFLAEADAEALESSDGQRLVLEGAEEEDEAPSWKSAAAVAKEEAEARAHAAARPQVSPARLELRAMGMAVDALCIAAGFVIFVSTAAMLAGERCAALGHLHKVTLGGVAGVVLVMLIVLYQALFFLLGKETPGMAYANLEFRGVAGGAPSRKAMARRLWANWMAVTPLGLGLLWAAVDGERLGWNDRMSGVYLREF